MSWALGCHATRRLVWEGRGFGTGRVILSGSDTDLGVVSIGDTVTGTVCEAGLTLRHI